MWLKRVEAERYGSLEGVSLGELAPGLTVVLGPNEAGKSSFTTLVRHVLYGFPDRRSKERGYYAEAGVRHGRLVFADDTGEWAVERIDGRGAGEATVRATSGPERPALHTDLTRGVSSDAYRVVFGFGLADMADVVGSSDDVVARLYAAGAGISVSPQDVRRELHSQRERLFKPSGRNPSINTAARDAGDLEKRIRTLRTEAEALAEKRERLVGLTQEAECARLDAEEAERNRDRIGGAVRDLERIEERLHAVREELVEKRTALLHARAQANEAVADPRVLDSASVIEALADESPVHRDRAERIAAGRQRISALERAIAERLDSSGIDAESAGRIQTDPDTRSAVDGWRDRLMRLELRAEESARAATGAANAARAVALSGTPAGERPQRSALAPAIAAWLLMALGSIGIIAGAVTGAWLLVTFAAVVEVLGVWIAFTSRSARSTMTGADGQAHAAELRRLAAEEARTSADARADGAELEAARGEWDAWRSGCGLGAAGTPAAATELIAAACEIRRLQTEHADSVAAARTEAERAEGFVVRVRQLADTLGIDAPVDSTDAPQVVRRARSMLEHTREQYEAGVRATEAADALLPRIEALEAAEADVEARAREIIEEQGFEGGHAEAEVYSAAASRQAVEARSHFDDVDRERATLAGEVGAMETESESSELALDLAGTREHIAVLAEEYAVAAVASALLDRAQQVYERERQPAVMRDAGRVLETMTAGRYGSVAVPLGSSAVEVFDTASRAKGTDVLSTGTAEQLYLSLRIALLGTLGEVGAGLPVLMDDVFANFDPERKRGAAAAVAELAAARQVVVFTCHPETVSVLAEADRDLVTLALDRC